MSTDSRVARWRRRWRARVGWTTLGALVLLVWRRTHRSARDERDGDILDPPQVRDLYDRVAPLYDVLTAPYTLLDGRRLARRAVSELQLRSGDVVVDLGTGTGWALPRLADQVGPRGRVIGVDISAGMLDRAQQRVRDRPNVDLVEADIASFTLPPGTRAVHAAFAIEMIPDYDAVIARISRELPVGGRIAVSGLRDPRGWPEWLVRLASDANRPFGVSADYRHLHPWEAVQQHTENPLYTDALGGAIYLAVGTASDSALLDARAAS